MKKEDLEIMKDINEYFGNRFSIRGDSALYLDTDIYELEISDFGQKRLWVELWRKQDNKYIPVGHAADVPKYPLDIGMAIMDCFHFFNTGNTHVSIPYWNEAFLKEKAEKYAQKRKRNKTSGLCG